MQPKTIIAALAAALLTTGAARAQESDDKLAWADIPGTWSGKFRIEENDCRWKTPPKRSFKLKAKLRAVTPYEDPEDGSLLAGKFGNLLFDGYWSGISEEKSASFWRNVPIRMANGWTCRYDTEINFLEYWGGDYAEAELVYAIICRGATICETRYSGWFEKKPEARDR